jgi:hypothetical protein
MARKKADVGKRQMSLPIPMIRTARVLHILQLRQKVASTKALLESDEKELAGEEEKVIHDLQARLPLEQGCPPCAIQVEKRRSISYKAELIKLKGEAWVKALLKKVVPKKIAVLVITEFSQLPLPMEEEGS